jgi:hypothetical protein
MKKTYLSILMVCLCFITQAQVNSKIKTYEYPSGNLTEEGIVKVLAEKKQAGVAPEELVMLNKIMRARMLQEQQDFLTGTSSKRQIVPNTINSTSCINPGFENGTNSDWTFASANVSLTTLPCNTCPIGTTAINQIVNSSSTVAGQCTSGIDTYGLFSVVAPGGNYSLLLNDATAGAKMQETKYSFVVTATSTIFTFQYAAVLNTGGNSGPPSYTPTHTNAMPYFYVDVTDNTTGSVIPCTQYTVETPVPPATIPGWSISALTGGSAPQPVYYKAWTTVSLDLSALISHTITVKYIVSDCANGGHFGYVYIDGNCDALAVSNTASICSGSAALLCGPPGYATYSWTGGGTGSSQCLSATVVGTYTLNTTSITGCPAPQITYTVSANPAAVANFSVANTPCSLNATFTDHSSVSGAGSITGWDWNFGDSGTAHDSLTTAPHPHTYSATGTYNVVMTCTTDAGCVGTYSTTVTLSSLPVTIASTSVACNGASTGSATTTATGGSGTYNYTWAPSVGTTSVVANLAQGTYVCTVSDGAGCSNSATVTVAQSPALTSTQTITPAYCSQADGGAAITMSGGAGTYTSYAWTPTGGGLSSMSSQIPGTYTCTVIDGNGCTYTTSAVVPNLPGPTVTAVTTTSVSCFGGADGTASATVSGSGISYTWLPSGGSFSTASGLSAGNYSVAVIDSHGCKDTSVVVAVNPATVIVPSFTVTPTPCGSSIGSATVSATGGAGGYTYTWTPAPASGTANNVSGLGAGTYSCTVKDVNGCSKVGTVLITTTTGPTVTAVQTSSVTCNGLSNGSASVTSVAGGTAPLSYTWIPGPGSPTVTLSGQQAGTYTVIVVDGAGCIGSDTATIIQPTPFITPLTIGTVTCNIANGDPINNPSLTSNGSMAVNAAGGTGALTYSWSPASVTSTTNTAFGLPVGTYTCFITDANNCKTNVVGVINSAPPITGPIVTTTVSCNPANTGNSSNGSAVVTASGGNGSFTYTWSPTVGANTSNSYANLPVGNYSVHINDVKGCVFDGTTSITGPATPVVVTSTFTPIQCNGGKGSASVTATGGASTSYTYAWTPAGGSTSVASNLPGTITGTIYTCTITDVNSCKTTTSFTLTQPTKVSGTVTSTSVSCYGASNGSISATLNNGTPGYTYQWLGTTPTQTTQTVNNLPAGTYTLVGADSKGCPLTPNKTIIVKTPEPKDTLKATGTLCSTDPTVTLSAPTGGASPNDITGYQWSLSQVPITGATGSTYLATQSNISLYTVTWLYHGCTYETKTMSENILPDLASLPQTNIFTPNSDTKNDEFYPFSLVGNTVIPSYSTVGTMMKSYNLYVYDRWGKLMYSTTDVTKPWTGTGATDGTYFWVVNFSTHCNTTGEQKLKGFVQLLR